MSFVKSGVKALAVLLILAAGAVSTVALYNWNELETAYLEKYDSAFINMALQREQLMRDHDRQMVFGKVLASQAAWEKAGSALHTAFVDERAERIQAERKEYYLRMEIYTFMKMLDAHYPGVKEEIFEIMCVETGPYGALGPNDPNEDYPDIPEEDVKAFADDTEVLLLNEEDLE